MDEQVEYIKKNAQFVIDQLGPLSDVSFGLNRESIAWVEGFIERQRARPDIDSNYIHSLVNTLGSFLGECIIANAGGSWRWSEEYQTWSVIGLRYLDFFMKERVKSLPLNHSHAQ